MSKAKMVLCVLFSFVVAALLASGLPIKFTIGFLLAVLVGFLFISRPLVFLFGLFLLRPALDEFMVSVRVPLGGADMGLGGLISLVLIVGALFNCLAAPSGNRRLHHPLFYLYLIFCLTQTGAFFYSADSVGAIKVLIQYFSILAIFILVLKNVKTDRDMRFILNGAIFSAIIPLIIGLVKFIMVGEGRFFGSFQHPNILAYYLMVMLGIVYLRFDKGEEVPRISIPRLLYLGALIAALIMTGTRSGWFALMIMMGTFALFFNRKVIIPLLLLVTILAFVPVVQERLNGLFGSYGSNVVIKETSSLAWRLQQWEGLFGYAKQKPWTGYGIKADVKFSIFEEPAHNDYLRYFIGSGVFGVLFYFMPYFYALLHFIKKVGRTGNLMDTKLTVFFVCYIPAFLIMSVSENLASYLVIHWYIWCFFGIYVSNLIFMKETGYGKEDNEEEYFE